MKSPRIAMIWELWQTSRFDLLIRIGGSCGFIILMRIVGNDPEGPAVQALRGIAVVMLMVTSVFSVTWLNEFDDRSDGFSFRLGFTRPVTTRTLILTPMLFTAATASLCYLLPALVFRIVMGTSIALFAPAAIVATGAICVTSIIWSFSGRAAKATALAALIAGAITVVAVIRLSQSHATPLLFAIGDLTAFQPDWLLGLISLCISLLSLQLAVVAVDRQRHGERLRPFSLPNAWRRRRINPPLAGRSPKLSEPQTRHAELSSAGEIDEPRISQRATKQLTVPSSGRRLRPFRSAVMAQVAYELQRFGGTVLCLSIAMPVAVAFFLAAVRYADPGWHYDGIVWSGALALGVLTYHIVGAEGAVGLKTTQGEAHLSAFDATRPMHNDSIMAIKVLLVTACTLGGFVIASAFAALHTWSLGATDHWTPLGNLLESVPRFHPGWWPVILCNVLLFSLATTSILIASGLWIALHGRWFAAGMAAVMLHAVVLAWDATHGWAYRDVWYSYACLLGIGIALLCMLMVNRAIQSGSVRASMLVVPVCLWLIYVASTVALVQQAVQRTPIVIPLPLGLFFASLLFIPIAAFAAAPLAYAAHRHR